MKTKYLLHTQINNIESIIGIYNSEKAALDKIELLKNNVNYGDFIIDIIDYEEDKGHK